MKTRFQLLPLLLVSLATALAGGTPAPAPAKTPVIAMCEPTVSQIRNIEEMYEKDILPLKTLTLLCIYHENEETDFQPSFDYVKTNNLDWVKFKAVKGLVARSDLFAENAWTSQFREIFASADGIIFTGGMDIPPDVFGQEALLLSEVTTPLRSLYEVSFLFHLVGGSQNPSFRPLLAERPRFPHPGHLPGRPDPQCGCRRHLDSGYPHPGVRPQDRRAGAAAGPPAGPQLALLAQAQPGSHAAGARLSPDRHPQEQHL